MFWRNYADLCEAVGKAPNVVAREVGIKSSGTVTGWRNGAIPRPSVLSKIAEYFGISVRDLVGEQKNEPTPGEGGGSSETAQRFMPLVDRLTPEQQQLLLTQIQAWIGQNELLSPVAPQSSEGKVPGFDP